MLLRFEWTAKKCSSIKGDPKKNCSYESAGGNLATNAALWLEDKGIMMPIHINFLIIQF
jgi:acetyl esterase/lipase